MSRPLIATLSAAAVAALLGAATLLSTDHSKQAEGLRLEVYADPVHGTALPTVCYGDTGPDVQFGQPRRTMAECIHLLTRRHWKRGEKILTCLTEDAGPQVTPGVVAMLISLDDNTGQGCANSIVRDLNAGVPREQACRRLTEQVATWWPAKRVNGRSLPDLTQAPVTGPTGWTLVKVAHGDKRYPINCRDQAANCRGLVLRRQAELAMCLHP